MERKVRVLDIYADWCAPCRALVPVIQKLEKEFAGQVEFAKVDAGDTDEAFGATMGKYNLRGVPTVIIEIGGEEDGWKELGRVVGFEPNTEQKLRGLIKKALRGEGKTPLTVLVFLDSQCGEEIHALLEDLRKRYLEVRFEEFQVEENPAALELADRYEVSDFPTALFFWGDKLLSGLAGEDVGRKLESEVSEVLED